MANRVVETIFAIRDQGVEKLKAIGNRFRQTADIAESSGKRIDKSTTRTSSLFSSLATGITKVRNALVTAGAVLAGFVAGLLKAARAGDEQERVTAQLEATLGRTTNATDEQIRALLEQASALQQSTRFGDEATISAQALLATFNLTAEEIQKLTPLLQDTVEANRKLGQENATLESTALAIGKAFTSGIGALTRYGVAVTNAQKAQFATADQAQKLSIILEALESNFGGAAEVAGRTFGGQLDRAKNAAGDFLETLGRAVAQSQPFQRLIESLTDRFTSLANTTITSGSTIQKVIDGVGRTVKTLTDALFSGIELIREYSGALVTLAKAFVAVKVTSLLVGLASLSARAIQAAKSIQTLAQSTATGTKRIGIFGAALRALPANVLIAVGVIGLDVATKGAAKLGEKLAELNVSDEVKASQERIRAELQATRNAAIEQIEALAKFRETQLLSSRDAAQLTDEQREAYGRALEGLKAYQLAQFRLLSTNEALGLATAEQSKQLEAVTEAVGKTNTAIADLGKGTQVAADAIENELTPGAQAFVSELEAIATEGDNAGKKLRELIDATLNVGTVTEIGDLAVALGEVTENGTRAGKALREDVIAAINDLDASQLLEFQSAAIAGFGELADGAEKSGSILRATLLAAMDLLGVKASQLGVDFTKAGREALTAFTVISENSQAAARQIEVSFNAALSQLSTRGEVEALDAKITTLARNGRVGLDALERSADKIRQRLVQIDREIDPLTESFERLGIVSQRELERAAEAARFAFNEIVDASRRGEAAQADVRRAFIATAESQLAAAQGASEYERRQVEAAIRTQAAAANVRDALREVGLAGEEAGGQVERGADQATAALERTEAAAEGVQQGLGGSGREADRAAGQFTNLGQSVQDAGTQIGVFSSTFLPELQRALQRGNQLEIDTLIQREEQRRKRIEEAIKAAESGADQFGSLLNSATSPFDTLDEQTQRRVDQALESAERELSRFREESARLLQDFDQQLAEAGSSPESQARLLERFTIEQFEQQLALARQTKDRELQIRIQGAIETLRRLEALERQNSGTQLQLIEQTEGRKIELRERSLDLLRQETAELERQAQITGGSATGAIPREPAAGQVINTPFGPRENQQPSVVINIANMTNLTNNTETARSLALLVTREQEDIKRLSR